MDGTRHQLLAGAGLARISTLAVDTATWLMSERTCWIWGEIPTSDSMQVRRRRDGISDSAADRDASAPARVSDSGGP
jgi:hypothetical protein